MEVLEAVRVPRAEGRRMSVRLSPGRGHGLPGKGISFDDGCILARQKIDDGSALEKMKELGKRREAGGWREPL